MNRPDNIDLTEEGSFVFGTKEPTIIDTRLFENQIVDVSNQNDVGTQQTRPPGKPSKSGIPPLPAGEPNDVMLGGLLAEKRLSLKTQFPGIGPTSWTPPDPSIAVGHNHIVQTVNQSIAFYTKDGTLQFLQRINDTNQTGFFDELNAGDFVFDPKCFYDHYSDRFFVLALEVYRDIDEAYITFAISDDDDPNGIWYKYRTYAVIDVGSSTYWVDYPGLGFDANGYYVTGNLFLLSGAGNAFEDVLFRSFEKAPLLNGEAAQYTDIRGFPADSFQVAQHFGGDNPAPYFLTRQSQIRFRITVLLDPFTNPSFMSSFVIVPQMVAPPGVPNGSSGDLLQVLDGRLMNVVWRDGSIWTCNCVENSSGDGSIVRWYEINTDGWPNSGTPFIAQSGAIAGDENNSTFYPAIYVDRFNNAGIVFGESGPGETPSVRATGRLNTDLPGTMGEVITLQTSTSSANGRWGDYFDIALDPTDELTFWATGEYQTPSGWRTSLNSFSMFVLGDVNGDRVVDLLDVEPFVNAISTGAFNAAADINGDESVDLLDVMGFVELVSGT